MNAVENTRAARHHSRFVAPARALGRSSVLGQALVVLIALAAAGCTEAGSDDETTGALSESLSTVRPDIAALWDSEPMVDGLLEPFYGVDKDGDGAWDENDFATGDFSQITTDTGSRVISGKLASPCNFDDPSCVDPNGIFDGGFSRHSSFYQVKVTDGVHFVKTAADLSCRHVLDGKPELVLYQQTLWGIDYPDGASDADRRTQTEQVAAGWLENGLRILQLEYSPSDNVELYEPGGQFAGAQLDPIDPGLTVQGDALARYALEHGGILDVSHSRDASVDGSLALSAEYAARRNRAVPVLANHANIDAPEWSREDRNKTLDEMCRVAASGGTVGVMPIAGFLPDGATFLTLIDEIDAIRNHACPMSDWKGEPIDMIDHINVASDSRVNYLQFGDNHYVDADAARLDRWRWLASEMLDRGDFDLEDVRRIFGANHLRALRAGLEGQLPFEPDLCSFPEGEVFTGDFDGDGRDDVLFHGSNGGTWIDYARRGGEFEGVDWKRSDSPTADQAWCLTGATRKLYVGDYNGDGRDDLLCHQSDGKSWIDYANSSGQFFGTNWDRNTNSVDKNWCLISATRELHIGDYNGDGREDLLCHQSDGRTWIDYANATGAFTGTNWDRDTGAIDKNWCLISSTRELHVGDFNGDGRDDLLCQQSDGRTWVDHANSTGAFNGTNWTRDVEPDPAWCLVGSTLSLQIADVDGDGRDDLVCHSESSGTLFVDRASTSGTFTGTDFNTDGGFCMLGTQSVLTGDVNGDDTDDILCYESEDGWLTLSLAEDGRYVYELEQTPGAAGGTELIEGRFQVQSDWGAGYCGEFIVTNTQAQSTSTWTATFSLNGATMANFWNLEVAVSGGVATLTPAEEWAAVIAAGNSSYSLGFCANRPNGGNALPGTPTVLAEF
jgi:microsomal dipeptidase-like Zn-dependent dipeptidase